VVVRLCGWGEKVDFIRWQTKRSEGFFGCVAVKPAKPIKYRSEVEFANEYFFDFFCIKIHAKNLMCGRGLGLYTAYIYRVYI